MGSAHSVSRLRFCDRFLRGGNALEQKPSGIEDLHGSARWATKDEIRATQLLPPKRRLLKPTIRERRTSGVVVGGWQEDPGKPVHLLKDNSKHHVLVFAPTRSGKGVSIVMPTVLDSWRESALVYDPKGEAWDLSAGFRRDELGQRVYKFDPASTGDDVAKYNPLAEIRIGTEHEVGDCQNLAQIICDPDGVGIDGKFFEEAANALLAALLLHVCYVAKSENRDATFGDLERWFGNPGEAMDEKLESLLRFPHITQHGREKSHPVIAREAQFNLNRAEKELSAVVSTALTKLTLFRDPSSPKAPAVRIGGSTTWSIETILRPSIW